jgi:hypothetical protein
MVKRILVLGIAALALALVAPTIGTGMNVAHAQTDPTAEAPDSGDTTAPDSGDVPEAPDQGDAPAAPDQGDAPAAPDQGDAPDAPDQGDSADDEGDDAEDSPCASSGARASGESCPPPAAQPQQPAPTNRPHERKPAEHGSSESNSNSGSGSVGQRVGSTVRPQIVQTTPVSAGIDTGTIPQGGIQAGAGGTADDGSQAGLLWSGALMLALAAGGLALRRRNALES